MRQQKLKIEQNYVAVFLDCSSSSIVSLKQIANSFSIKSVLLLERVFFSPLFLSKLLTQSNPLTTKLSFGFILNWSRHLAINSYYLKFYYVSFPFTPCSHFPKQTVHNHQCDIRKTFWQKFAPRIVTVFASIGKSWCMRSSFHSHKLNI